MKSKVIQKLPVLFGNRLILQQKIAIGDYAASSYPPFI
ncbi:hypothetical protein B4140_2185 [Bacillus amyloliquefaciens]|nr:hypothetical protein B4140_2185 [Bacillus amyloliquefaciens]